MVERDKELQVALLPVHKGDVECQVLQQGARLEVPPLDFEANILQNLLLFLLFCPFLFLPIRALPIAQPSVRIISKSLLSNLLLVEGLFWSNR